MSLLVKICGLGDKAALTAALASGADAVGFVFHAGSPRNLEPQRAALLAQLVPAGVLTVAVTRAPGPALVAAVLAVFRPGAWQSDADDFARMDLPPGIARWPVLRSGQALPAVLPARLLYEGPRSGAGERADWREAASLAGRTELVLGGGLTPANVGEAVRRVRPFGVDVSSGVERAPGVKDAALIADFVAAARAAAGGVSDG